MAKAEPELELGPPDPSVGTVANGVLGLDCWPSATRGANTHWIFTGFLGKETFQAECGDDLFSVNQVFLRT